MGMDLGRGSGGRAPFLVIGLLFICIVLVFNWWSLSTQNLELYHQLEERGEHLKIGSRKIIECSQFKQELEKELLLEKQSSAQKLKEHSAEIEELNVKLQKAKEESNHNADSFSHCNMELDSLKKVRRSQEALIDSRRVEKEQLESELKDKKAEISRLQAQLKEVQEKLDQKVGQVKEAAAPAKDETNPINHEGRNAVDADRAAADVNNAREQTDDTENREAENNIEDPREKEQEGEVGDKNTIDAPQSN